MPELIPNKRSTQLSSRAPMSAPMGVGTFLSLPEFSEHSQSSGAREEDFEHVYLISEVVDRNTSRHT